jgi:predicted dehydrogenase
MKPAPSRRDILQQGGAAVLGAQLAAFPTPFVRRGTQTPGGAELLKVGLIGCGGRGTGAAANALMADPNVKLVALGDAFSDHLESSLATLRAQPEIAAKIDVPPERRFTGFDAYKGVIEASDVVLFATSPFFRPLHVEACVAAGKHMFVEKPVATDGPGLRRIWAACEQAKQKGLSLVTGLCYRYQFAKQETIKRVHDGAIGDIVAMQCTYNTSELWHRGRKPEWTEMEFQMRNWLYFTWLSGDLIAEQHIHSLDKLAWAKGSYPVKCTSSGGRVKRTGPEYGEVYDHFNTVYEWADGVRGFSSCRQWNGTATDVSDHAFGTKGVAHLQTHEIDAPGAKWRYASEAVDDMYQNEHDALFRSIRSGKPIYDGDIMCSSTLMALMGRLAAYTGQEVTRDQALQSTEDLTPPALAFGPAPAPSVAVPGVKKLV